MHIIETKYEVYIEHRDIHSDESLMTHWTWHKLSDEGLVTVRGSRHSSLEACFASVRKHRDASGNAPIRINLCKGQVSDAPKIVALAGTEPNIPIPSQALSYATA